MNLSERFPGRVETAARVLLAGGALSLAACSGGATEASLEPTQAESEQQQSAKNDKLALVQVEGEHCYLEIQDSSHVGLHWLAQELSQDPNDKEVIGKLAVANQFFDMHAVASEEPADHIHLNWVPGYYDEAGYVAVPDELSKDADCTELPFYKETKDKYPDFFFTYDSATASQIVDSLGIVEGAKVTKSLLVETHEASGLYYGNYFVTPFTFEDFSDQGSRIRLSNVHGAKNEPPVPLELKDSNGLVNIYQLPEGVEFPVPLQRRTALADRESVAAVIGESLRTPRIPRASFFRMVHLESKDNTDDRLYFLNGIDPEAAYSTGSTHIHEAAFGSPVYDRGGALIGIISDGWSVSDYLLDRRERLLKDIEEGFMPEESANESLREIENELSKLEVLGLSQEDLKEAGDIHVAVVTPLREVISEIQTIGRPE